MLCDWIGAKPGQHGLLVFKGTLTACHAATHSGLLTGGQHPAVEQAVPQPATTSHDDVAHGMIPGLAISATFVQHKACGGLHHGRLSSCTGIASGNSCTHKLQ